MVQDFEHRTLLANGQVSESEFYSFLVALGRNGLGKDLYELVFDTTDGRMGLAYNTPKIPSLTEFYGRLDVIADSTLKTKVKKTAGGNQGPEIDLADCWSKLSRDKCAVCISPGATLTEIIPMLQDVARREDSTGDFVDIEGADGGPQREQAGRRSVRYACRAVWD